MTRKVFVAPNGEVRFVYSDEVMTALGRIGRETVRRASHVEPTQDGGMVVWFADMSPVGGGSQYFVTRAQALAWEVRELERMGAPLPQEG